MPTDNAATDYPSAEPPAVLPKTPEVRAPVGACDAHVHMLAGVAEHPLWEKRSENPADGLDFEAWLDTFLAHLNVLGCSRTLIVHSILYGTDNSVTLQAVKRLGDAARGVCLVPDDVTDAVLDDMADANMVAVRLNYVHGGVLTWDGAKAMAPRLAERGMHVQMLAHADRHLEELEEDVRAMPVPVVFDHAGWPADGVNPSHPGFDALTRLMADGHAYVKLSGLYRFTDSPFEASDALIDRLARANPERCLWGSDWPHIMLNGAGMPDAGVLLDAFHRVVTDDVARHRILVENPAKLFRF